MSTHQHDYRPLGEAAIFCKTCGDIKTASPPICALPHYPTYWPDWTYRPPNWYRPQPWVSPFIYSTTTSDITVGNTITLTPADFEAMSFTGGLS